MDSNRLIFAPSKYYDPTEVHSFHCRVHSASEDGRLTSNSVQNILEARDKSWNSSFCRDSTTLVAGHR